MSSSNLKASSGLDPSAIEPRNSREKLLSLTKERSVTPQKRTFRNPELSRSKPPTGGYFRLQRPYTFVLVASLAFVTGTIFSPRSWNRSPTLSESPDDRTTDNGIRMSHLHSEVLALEHQVTALGNLNDDIQQLKQLNQKYDSIHTKIEAVKSSLNEAKEAFALQLKDGLLDVMKTCTKQQEQKQSTNAIAQYSQTAETLEQMYRKLYPGQIDQVDWGRSALGSFINQKFTTPGLNRNAKSTIKSVLVSYLPSKYHQRLPPLSKRADVVIGGPEAAKVGCIHTESLTPGCCYAFPGSSGNITINLPGVIRVSQVQIEHVNPNESPTASSAPKTIAVYVDSCSVGDERFSNRTEESHRRIGSDHPHNEEEGRRTSPQVMTTSSRSEEDKQQHLHTRQKESCWGHSALTRTPSVLIGQFVFGYPNVSSQVFTVDAAENLIGREATRRIRFSILDNYGHPGHTCVYRLRVYGTQVIRPDDI